MDDLLGEKASHPPPDRPRGSSWVLFLAQLHKSRCGMRTLPCRLHKASCCEEVFVVVYRGTKRPLSVLLLFTAMFEELIHLSSLYPRHED
jgi:hypothetical protein